MSQHDAAGYPSRYILMKFYALIIAVIILATANNAAAFKFFSTQKSAVISTDHMSEQISEIYGHEFRVFSITVAAKSKNALFRQQSEVLSDLSAEELSLIFITALADRSSTSGYHTTPEVASTLLGGSEFKVLIHSPKGVLLKEYGQVVSAGEITSVVKEYNQAVKAGGGS